MTRTLLLCCPYRRHHSTRRTDLSCSALERNDPELRPDCGVWYHHDHQAEQSDEPIQRHRGSELWHKVFSRAYLPRSKIGAGASQEWILKTQGCKVILANAHLNQI